MDILRPVLELVRQHLEADFQTAEPRRSTEWVALTSPTDLDGRIVDDARDKVVMMLAGLQSESIAAPIPRPLSVSGDQFVGIPPPLYLDPFVLFLANFTPRNYSDGLWAISHVIGFFQQHPVFTRDNLPGLPPQIDKITLDFVNLDVTQTHHLIGMLGLRYLPLVLYKLRMLPFIGSNVAAVAERS